MLDTKARMFIRFLETRGFYAECPCCQEPVLLKKCGLFYLDNFTDDAQRVYSDLQNELRERALALKRKPAEISSKSSAVAEATNKGRILERLAPAMKAFRFDRNDCRAIFDPIDYVIFENLSSKGTVSKVFFAEVKTGEARHTRKQKDIRSLVESKKVSLGVYSSGHNK